MAKINLYTTEEEIKSTGGNFRPLIGAGPRANGIRMHMVGATSIKDNVNGVTLPSYDYNLDPCDTAFPMSVGSCWRDVVDKNYPNHFVPNGWAIPYHVYTYVGENNDHFFSPSNLNNMISEGHDPSDAFNDLWAFIKWNKQMPDSEKDYYLKKPTVREDARVPSRQTRFFELASITTKESNTPTVTLMSYTSAAHSYKVEQMRWRREDTAPVLDPTMPRYLLGDPTRPANALAWRVAKVRLDPKEAQETNCVVYTDKREILDPVIVQRAITQRELAQRYLLMDPANWNIPTYQEMVDYMVDNFKGVPVDLIRAACGSKAHVKDRSANGQPAQQANYSAPAAQEAAYDPMAQALAGANAEPARSYAPAPVSTPAPMPTQAAVPMPVTVPTPASVPMPVTEVRYLAGSAGSTPAMYTKAELSALPSPGTTMVQVNGTWMALTQSGLIAVNVVPQVVPQMVPAVVPQVVPQMAPQAATAVTQQTTSNPVTMEEVRTQLCDDARYALLSPSGKAEIDDLTREMHALRVNGLPQTPEILDRIMAVVSSSFA